LASPLSLIPHFHVRTIISCTHFKEVGLENSKDSRLWSYAKENGYCIVTFDADFYDLGLVKGSPPKVIW
jgi:predicted nuclease of predicted toxin-antitoxin system